MNALKAPPVLRPSETYIWIAASSWGPAKPLCRIPRVTTAMFRINRINPAENGSATRIFVKNKIEWLQGRIVSRYLILWRLSVGFCFFSPTVGMGLISLSPYFSFKRERCDFLPYGNRSELVQLQSARGSVANKTSLDVQKGLVMIKPPTSFHILVSYLSIYHVVVYTIVG